MKRKRLRNPIARVSRLLERSGTVGPLLCMLGRTWRGPLRPSWRVRKRHHQQRAALFAELLQAAGGGPGTVITVDTGAGVLQRQAMADVHQALKRGRRRR